MAPLAGASNVGATGAGGLRVNVALRETPPEVPVITADVCEETPLVVTVKVRLVDPAATVTLAGTVTALELSESITTAPPEGAAALTRTVPVEELPPITAVGLNDTELSPTDEVRVTFNAVTCVVLPRVAESWTLVGPEPGEVATGKVALVAPAGTDTVSGTLADPGRLLPRVTVAPPVGAGAPSVTVPMDEVPALTLLGLTLSLVSAGRAGATVSVAVRVTPRPVTEIVTGVGAATAAVVMSNRPSSVEAFTVANSGTLAIAGLLLVTRTSWSWPASSESGMKT